MTQFPKLVLAKAIRRFCTPAHITALLVLALLLVNPLLAFSRRAPLATQPGGNNTTVETQPPAVVDSFIIEAINGVTSCREARPKEVWLTLPRPDDQRTPITRNYLPEMRQAVVTAGENLSPALTINFVALSQLNSNPNRDTIIAAFQRAAANWTARIKSPTTVTVNIDYGPNPPGSTQPFPSGVLGATSSGLVQIDYPSFRINLSASASSSAEASLYSALPNGSVPSDAGNGSVVSVSRTVARQLGLTVPSSPTEDATIGFNGSFSFDFNPDDGITPGQRDFVAVATHELGHALGFVSGSGGGATAAVRPWDLFRFRPGMTMATFPTAPRVMVTGGTQVYFTGQTFQNFSSPTSSSPPLPSGTTLEPGLSTGGPSGSAGDGRQSSHWKDDGLTGTYIGIMDPDLAAGIRVEPTENDFSVLETIGWDLSGNAPIPPAPPPPPPPLNDHFSDGFGLIGCGGRVQGNNIGATKQSNEPNNSDSPGSTRSVWYQWQATTTGSVTFDTAGSNFDTVLEIFTGSDLDSLTSIGHNDDRNGSDLTSVVTFNVTQGTIYRIVVNGFNNGESGGDIGSINLNWFQSPCNEPARFLIPQTDNPNLIAALDAVTFVRAPFHVFNPNNFSPDHRTTIMFFIFGLTFTEADSAGSAIDVEAGTRPLFLQRIGALTTPGLSATYVIVSLPTDIPAGDYPLNVRVRNVPCSNSPVISIAGP